MVTTGMTVSKSVSFGGLVNRDASVTQIRIYTIVGLLLIWEMLALLGRFEILYGDVIPSSWIIIYAVWTEIISAGFYRDLGITFAEHAVGFVGGSIAAIFVGIGMGTNPFFRKALEPYLNAIGSTPKIIFLPILFLMFGTGIESKMAKGCLSSFFPVVFSTTLGIILINPVLIRVGESFNLNKWQMFTKIYMPAMVNPIITGLRLGMAITVIGVLVAELKFADGGLGYRLGVYYEKFEIAPMYAIILIIFALAALANVGMTLLQDRMNRHMLSDSGKTKTAKVSGSLGVVATN